MIYQRSWLRVMLAVAVILILAACDLDEPVKIGGLTISSETQNIPQTKTQAICRAIEDAGYIMPYGPSLTSFDFTMTQLRWVANAPNGSQFGAVLGKPYLFIAVGWDIPGDFNQIDAVNQATIDQQADVAEKICRIVQQKAIQQGIGPIRMTIRLWDLVTGFIVEYGQANSSSRSIFGVTDCEHIKGYYIGRSNGLHPQSRTPGRCPSLYVDP